MYLANQNGGLSDYCLNVGQAIGSSYYLSISKGSNANFLFKYYESFTDSNGLVITKTPYHIASTTPIYYILKESPTNNNIIKSNFIPVTFKGYTFDNSIYLIVPKLDVNESFDMKNTDKYYT
ncbi:hypothetical protein BCR36DRAFT_451565 [Piromyces finnis]|uniref:Uncharacterized protein n=1 Tax=Piromyces finnis TaxID=1754191 RepID=A0A1Y1V837_9FUNG|nr:hypothetical protein BCR36DRAFT_451565 [Piromyces finnis]|eukprot:ORX48700.1 hypothetical protein BCR36DRAFT_451565 [Piromyces finnis]